MYKQTFRWSLFPDSRKENDEEKLDFQWESGIKNGEGKKEFPYVRLKVAIPRLLREKTVSAKDGGESSVSLGKWEGDDTADREGAFAEAMREWRWKRGVREDLQRAAIAMAIGRRRRRRRRRRSDSDRDRDRDRDRDSESRWQIGFRFFWVSLVSVNKRRSIRTLHLRLRHHHPG